MSNDRSDRFVTGPGDVTVIRGSTPADWAEALEAATAALADEEHDGDRDAAAHELRGSALDTGSLAGVCVPSREVQEHHELADNQVLSADGLWLATWRQQQSRWTADRYERPKVRIAIDMRYDLFVAGLTSDEFTVARYLEAWRNAAQTIADDLLVDLVIVEAEYGSDVAASCDATVDGHMSIAGRIWQGAHNQVPED